MKPLMTKQHRAHPSLSVASLDSSASLNIKQVKQRLTATRGHAGSRTHGGCWFWGDVNNQSLRGGRKLLLTELKVIEIRHRHSRRVMVGHSISRSSLLSDPFVPIATVETASCLRAEAAAAMPSQDHMAKSGPVKLKKPWSALPLLCLKPLNNVEDLDFCPVNWTAVLNPWDAGLCYHQQWGAPRTKSCVAENPDPIHPTKTRHLFPSPVFMCQTPMVPKSDD